MREGDSSRQFCRSMGVVICCAVGVVAFWDNYGFLFVAWFPCHAEGEEKMVY